MEYYFVYTSKGALFRSGDLFIYFLKCVYSGTSTLGHLHKGQSLYLYHLCVPLMEVLLYPISTFQLNSQGKSPLEHEDNLILNFTILCFHQTKQPNRPLYTCHPCMPQTEI